MFKSPPKFFFPPNLEQPVNDVHIFLFSGMAEETGTQCCGRLEEKVTGI